MAKRIILSLLLVCISMSPLAATDTDPLAATVGTDLVEVRHVTPRGDVVFMFASLEGVRGVLRQVTGAKRINDDDGDGVVRLPVRAIPYRSIWVAVDVESGRHVIAGPNGYPLTILPFPSTLLKKDADGIVGLLDAEMVSAEILLVRPKHGAWHFLAVEGGGRDGDKNENKLGLLNADAAPVGDSGAAPKHLRNGDIFAVIDPGRMEIFVTEIGK